ncbi:MAG TPA: hypothetical protein VMS76_01380 [Planctomycetota bacterium]|nr:hypothetical protein [Planctomycetota bacterium]
MSFERGDPGRGPQAGRAVGRAWFRVGAFGAVVALLSALCLFYTGRFHHFATVNDLWFGSDIWRHVAWANDPSEAGRWQLHPGSFLLFDGYGRLLRALGLEPSPDELLGFAMPVIALVALGLVAAAERLARHGTGGRASPWAVAAVLAAVGPVVAFGPMPESHILGGTALLLQAVWVLSVLRDEAAGASGPQVRSRTAGAIALGAVAASFTVTNLLPATILLWALRRLRRPLVRAALVGALAGAALLAVHKLVAPLPLVWPLVRTVRYEMSLLTPPHALQIGWSFQHLVLFQFGMPRTELITWTHPADGAVVTSIHSASATPLQWAAFALWLAAVGLWVRRGRAGEPAERRFGAYCAAALLALLAFHVPFSAWEAYIFSPHAWPYVVVPGVLAWRWGMQARNRAVILCVAAAVALSLLQTAYGLWWLEHLPGDTGSRPG